MNCDKCADLISAYIDGELDKASSQAVKEHLDSCTECEQLYRDLSALSETASLFADVAVPDELISRVMSSVGNSKLTVHKTIVIPAWVTNWKVYSSVAACLLAVFLIRGGIDKKYHSYTMENYNYTYESKLKKDEKALSDGSAEQSTSPTPTPTASPDENVQNEPSPEAQDLSAEQTPATHTAPANDVALPSIASTQGDMAVYTADEAEEASAPKARITEDTHAPASGGSLADGDGGAGGGASGGSISSLSLSSQKEELLSGYSFSESSSMVERQIVFKITSSADMAKASELFASNRSKGASAVQSAFDSAGISYTKSEEIIYDHTSSYNALVRRGNSYKEQIKNASDYATVNTLSEKLLATHNEISAISKNCSTVKIVLN